MANLRIRRGNRLVGMHTPGSPAQRPRHRGTVLVCTVLGLMLMVLCVGLALDTAAALLAAQQLQNAADAAALAGVGLLYDNPDAAREKAWEIARANAVMGEPVEIDRNYDNLATGGIVFGRYNRGLREFYPDQRPFNAVQVTARRVHDDSGEPDAPMRGVPLVFGPMVGVHTVNMTRSATAMISGGTGAGLLCLKDGAHPDMDYPALTVRGTATLIVTDISGLDAGVMQINDPGFRAVDLIGGGGTGHNIIADALELVGDIRASYDPNILGFPIDTGAEAVADPLAGLRAPEYYDWPDLAPAGLASGSGTLVVEPGLYSGGLRITGGTVIFKPGVYVLGGRPNGGYGLYTSGSASVIARGCMFYIMGEYGEVGLYGTGRTVIAPPDPDAGAGYYDQRNYDSDFVYPSVMVGGVLTPVDPTTFAWPHASYPAGTDATYDGISIFQSRTNYKKATLTGTNLLDLEGALYFPRNHVYISGTGDGEFGAQLISWSLEVTGTGKVRIQYDGRNKTAGSAPYLVR